MKGSRELTVEQDASTLLLSLNRHERRNALTPALLAQLGVALAEAARDPGVRTVVLTGAGSAFCSGADIDSGGRSTATDEGSGMRPLLHKVALAMRGLDKPVIAAVNGPAVGAGLALAMMADLRVVASDARLVEGYIGIGVFPGAGDTYFLPRLVGTAQALRMMWTADTVTGEDAVRLGLAEECVPAGEVLATALALAARLAERPAKVVAQIKQATYDMQTMPLSAALDLAASYGDARTEGPQSTPKAARDQDDKERRR